MFALEYDRKRKLLFALRVAAPIVVLIALLTFAIFTQERSFLYSSLLFGAGVVASAFFIYIMFHAAAEERRLDHITPTFSRTFFEKFLREHCRQDNALVLVSLENIKEINEHYGMERGDALLRSFSQKIGQFFASHFGSVPIARMRAGDFLVLVPLSDNMEQIIQQCKSVCSSFDDVEIEVFVTYLPCLQDSHKTVQHLYDDLFQWKNLYALEKRELIAQQKREHIEAFEEYIIDQVQKKELSFLFQPILNLHTNRIEIFEVHVKLRDPEGKFIHPSRYIPIINRLGYENIFDLAIVEKLLDIIALGNFQESFSFNLSPYSLRKKEFFEQVSKLFHTKGIAPQQCIIEVYENSVYRDVQKYNEIIQKYRNFGFRIAFDNFGVYNASLAYIRHIPVDFVYFDKEFSQRSDPRTVQILKHWIHLLQTLQTATIAKFVDTQEIYKRLQKLGVDYVQGYAIAKPMNQEELWTWKKS